jgi:hypothetical protein
MSRHEEPRNKQCAFLFTFDHVLSRFSRLLYNSQQLQWGFHFRQQLQRGFPFSQQLQRGFPFSQQLQRGFPFSCSYILPADGVEVHIPSRHLFPRMTLLGGL